MQVLLDNVKKCYLFTSHRHFGEKKLKVITIIIIIIALSPHCMTLASSFTTVSQHSASKVHSSLDLKA